MCKNVVDFVWTIFFEIYDVQKGEHCWIFDYYDYEASVNLQLMILWQKMLFLVRAERQNVEIAGQVQDGEKFGNS